MKRAAGRACVLLLLALGLTLQAAATSGQTCPGEGGAVQVLGSGGPAPDVGRASSAYLLWLDGHARILIDAGGGAFARFSESGARLEDLWLVALSHFHTDHSAEFPAFLKGFYFTGRTAALTVAGPSGSEPFPGLRGFLESMFGQQTGAFRYLSGYLSGDEAFRIDPIEIFHGDEASHPVFSSGALKVTATGVPHGIVPALSFRLNTGQKTVVFASDQNGQSDAFIEFARGADLLIMHLAIPEDASDAARRLHAPPSRIGEIAKKTGAGRLLLSHFMSRSLGALDASIALVRENYPGPVIVAQDLLCIPVTGEAAETAGRGTAADTPAGEG